MPSDALSSIEFDFLWESAGAGEVPYPLELRSHGATMDERGMLRRQTLDVLARRGVVDERGIPYPRLGEQFGVLARPEVSIDSVHIAEPGATTVRALCGAIEEEALLAVQDARGLHLREVPPDGLAGAVVALFPAGRRGRERSVTMPLDGLMSGAGADFLQRRSGNGSAVDEDRKVFARLHAQPRLRGGQIGVNLRSAAGGRSRTPVLGWFDTDSGRYLTQVSRGSDGRDWLTVAPADAATLRHRVGEMMHSVRCSPTDPATAGRQARASGRWV